MVLKLNKKLELVNTTRLASAASMLTSAGVAVVDDHVLAYSSGSIDIYTTDLEHVEQITLPNHGSPGSKVTDIFFDKTGNLYILQESSCSSIALKDLKL